MSRIGQLKSLLPIITIAGKEVLKRAGVVIHTPPPTRAQTTFSVITPSPKLTDPATLITHPLFTHMGTYPIRWLGLSFQWRISGNFKIQKN